MGRGCSGGTRGSPGPSPSDVINLPSHQSPGPNHPTLPSTDAGAGPLSPMRSTWHRAGEQALLFLGGQRSPAVFPPALRRGAWDLSPPPPAP